MIDDSRPESRSTFRFPFVAWVLIGVWMLLNLIVLLVAGPTPYAVGQYIGRLLWMLLVPYAAGWIVWLASPALAP
jgi:hypothetical protein